MAIEPKTQGVSPELALASPIENEIAAYRAISPLAVFALLCGVLSILSFASWYFLVFSAIAVIGGFYADRKIQRMPDALTGRNLAQAAVGLGFMFGLSAVAIAGVQYGLRAREANAFAKIYGDVLKKGTFADMVWWAQPPTFREKREPQALLDEMTKSQQAAQSFEQKNAGLRDLKLLLDQDSASDVHYDGLESHGEDGLNYYAFAIYEIHTPSAKKAENKERLAMAYMKGAKNAKGKWDWWIEAVTFPYKRQTFVPPAAPVDDGHGHAPGESH